MIKIKNLCIMPERIDRPLDPHRIKPINQDHLPNFNLIQQALIELYGINDVDKPICFIGDHNLILALNALNIVIGNERTIEQAYNLINEFNVYQLEAINQSFTLEDVTSDWFGKHTIEAFRIMIEEDFGCQYTQSNIDYIITTIRGCNEIQAEGISLGSLASYQVNDDRFNKNTLFAIRIIYSIIKEDKGDELASYVAYDLAIKLDIKDLKQDDVKEFIEKTLNKEKILNTYETYTKLVEEDIPEKQALEQSKVEHHLSKGTQKPDTELTETYTSGQKRPAPSDFSKQPDRLSK